MNAFVNFASRPHWNPQEIADAVPLRLFEMDLFDVRDARPCAKRDAADAARTSYLRAAPGLFRIR